MRATFRFPDLPTSRSPGFWGGWSEAEFHERLAGSAIHRIGYERWLRNLAVGLGNAPTSDAVIAALGIRAGDASSLVRDHVAWALQRHHVRA